VPCACPPLRQGVVSNWYDTNATWYDKLRQRLHQLTSLQLHPTRPHSSFHTPIHKSISSMPCILAENQAFSQASAKNRYFRVLPCISLEFKYIEVSIPPKKRVGTTARPCFGAKLQLEYCPVGILFVRECQRLKLGSPLHKQGSVYRLRSGMTG
jgi:hypothetical protein